MNQQINLRLPETLIINASKYCKKNGFGTLQEFIKETIREKLFPDINLTKKELKLVKQLIKVSETKNLYGTEKELFKKLNRS